MMKTQHKHSAHPGEPASAPKTVDPDATDRPVEPQSPGVVPELDGKQPVAEILPLPVSEDIRLREQLLRLQADFDNYRKRTAREQGEWSRRIREKVLLDVLPVLDNLERAEQQAREHQAGEAFVDGLTLVIQLFQAILQKQGVQPITSAGEVFDPKLHDAISLVPSADQPEGIVLAETLKGYLLDKEALRHAQVVVSAGSPALSSASGEEPQ